MAIRLNVIMLWMFGPGVCWSGLTLKRSGL